MTESMWAWAVLGIILLAVEIMVAGGLYAFWFAIAAFCVCVLIWLMPDLSYALQLIVFAVLSLGTLAIWRRFYKKHETHYHVGQAQGEEIGRVGTVIEATSNTQGGRIQFAQGLLGSREWVAYSDQPIAAGSQASVVAVEGNTLRIAQVSN